MNATAPFYQQLSDIFSAYGHKVETVAGNYGWYKAWLEKEPPLTRRRSGKLFEDEIELSKSELQQLIPFIADKLLQADPTPEKTYAPQLFRWFRYGMHYSSLEDAKEILARYHRDRMSGIHHTVEPYSEVHYVSTRTGAEGRKPAKRDLLKERLISDIKNYFDRYDLRQDFLRNSRDVDKRDRRFVRLGSAVVYHESPALRVYGLRTGAAKKAYGINIDYRHSAQYGKRKKAYDTIQVELANGAQYWIDLQNLIAQGEETGFGHSQKLNFNRMLRDIPDLVPALNEAIKDFVAHSTRRWFWHDPIWNFTKAASRVCDKNLLPEGEIAERFTQRYTKQLGQISVYMNHLATKKEDDGVSSHETPPLVIAPEDMEFVSRFKVEREKVGGALIRQIYDALCLLNLHEKAQKLLAAVVKVPHWREVFQADAIIPLFQAVEPYKDKRSGLFRVHLFCLTAKYKNWRNGEEAKHLPKAIDYLLKQRDWPKLKTILVCACLPDNSAWREAIDRDTREKVSTYRFDNAYNHHHIGTLIGRLNAMDAGTYIPNGLRNAPRNEHELIGKQRNDMRLRQQRAAKRMGAAKVRIAS